jgi:predicted nuclease of predicted toxin-antitoxin system
VKLLLDENLSPRLVASITDIYPDSSHIEDCGLLAASDDQVWRFALENGFTIVTKDSDFSERSVLDGCPPKVVWLRIGNCKTSQAERLLRKGLSEIQAFLHAHEDCCLVLSVAISQLR